MKYKQYNINLFNKEGWLDIPEIIRQPFPFIFITGARGTGKTYGMLEEGVKAVENGRKKFIYMRRTDKQIKKLSNEAFNPYKPLNEDFGWDYAFTGIPGGEGITGVYHMVYNPEKDRVVPVGAPYGFGMSLASVAGLRGFASSDVGYMFFDEFIRERGERQTIPDEGEVLFNAYETINRNRELEGYPPVKLILASNSNSLNSDILLQWKLIHYYEVMQKNLFTAMAIPKRGILIIMPKNSPISQKKENTALYRMAGKNSQFGKMALGNEFAYDDYSYVRRMSIRQFKPTVRIGEISICENRDKNQDARIYVCGELSGKHKYEYNISESDRARFARNHGRYLSEYMGGHVFFESASDEYIFRKYYKLA